MIPISWPINDAWQQPEMLRLLKGTPFDTLLTKPTAEFSRAANALELRLIAPDTVPTAPLTHLAPGAAGVAIVSGSLWPHVRAFKESGGLAGGPTGSPWVDSNGWLIRIAQCKAASSDIWLMHPPPRNRVLAAADYQLAVADAATWGAHWVVQFDDSLQRDLAANKPDSLRIWKTIGDTVSAFVAHAAGRSYHAVARLAVVSRFDDPVMNDALNLLARRHVSFMPSLPEHVDSLPFASLRAIYCTEPVHSSLLDRFAKSGGQLIQRSDLLSSGGDPYLLATALHRRLSRREDLVRLWNAGTLATYYRETGGADCASVDLVNYSAHVSSDDQTLQVTTAFAKARIVSLGRGYSDLKIQPGVSGTEVALPPFPVYARVEFSERIEKAP